MNLPTDLRDFRPSEDEDAFVILTPEQCVCALCAIAVFALLFAPWLA